jgi:hypothetical protein
MGRVALHHGQPEVRRARQKLDGLSSQTRRKVTMATAILWEDSLMSVLPSIIVLVITALLVFRRELIAALVALASRLGRPGAARRLKHQIKWSQRPLRRLADKDQQLGPASRQDESC